MGEQTCTICSMKLLLVIAAVSSPGLLACTSLDATVLLPALLPLSPGASSTPDLPSGLASAMSTSSAASVALPTLSPSPAVGSLAKPTGLCSPFWSAVGYAGLGSSGVGKEGGIPLAARGWGEVLSEAGDDSMPF